MKQKVTEFPDTVGGFWHDLCTQSPDIVWQDLALVEFSVCFLTYPQNVGPTSPVSWRVCSKTWSSPAR